MKIVRLFGTAVATVTFSFAAQSVTGTTINEDKTSQGDWEVTVDAGKTNVVMVAQTGSGKIVKKGAGTLRLTVTSSFTGGTEIDEGVVEIAATDALGKGKITAKADGSKKCQLAFVKNGMTTDNDLEVIGTSSVTQPVVYFNSGTNIWNGNISSSGDLYFCDNGDWAYIGTGGTYDPTKPRDKAFSGSSWSTKVRPLPFMTFNGTVSAPNGTIYLVPDGTFAFKGKVTCKLFDNMMDSRMFTLHVLADENFYGSIDFCHANEIGELRMGYRANTLSANDAVKDMVINWGWYDADLSRTSCSLNHGNGIISHAAAITGAEMTKNRNACSIAGGSSANHAKLFISGYGFEGKEAVSYACVDGYVDVIVDGTDHPGFTQTFTLRNHKTHGTLAVTNATMRLTNNATFPNVTSIAVGPGGRFELVSGTSYPFSGTLTSVELATDAVLGLSEGCELKTASLKIGDRTYTAGLFSPATCPQLQSGSITVTGTPGTMTWTGAGEDENLSTTGNWEEEPDLAFGSKKAVFATGGTRAVVDVNAVFGGIGFTAANGFALVRAAAPKTLTLAGDITATTPGRYMVDNPLAVVGSRTVDTTGGGAITFKDAFTTNGALPGQLTLVSQNVCLEGTNIVAGGIVMNTNRVTVAGLLATPGHLYEGRPEDAAGAFYINLANAKDGMKENSGLCLSNAVIEKAVYVNNIIGTTAIYAPAGTTNEIKGFFRYTGSSDWEKFRLLSKSELTLSGGFEAVHSFRVYDGGTLRIKNYPGSFLEASGLNPHNGTVILEVPNNTFKYLCVGYPSDSTAKVETTVDGALTNGYVQVGGNGGKVDQCVALASGTYTLDLHCTRQKCQKLAVLTKGILTGTYPAMLEVTEGRAAADPSGYAIDGQVTGGVGLHLSGAGTLEFKKTFTSAGDLEVSNGTMSFAANASWKNGTNVTVRGTGIFQVSDADVLGRAAHLTLADSGKLSIPSGVTLAVKKATLNGVDVAPGTYATGALGGRVTGGGSLCVRGDGLLLMVW